MADMSVKRTRDIEREDKPPKRVEKEMLLKVDRIRSDSEKPQATIGKSRTVGHSLPFGSFKISDTTTVTVQCDQDAKTMVLADEIARHFVRKFLKKDMDESTEILQAVAEEEERLARKKNR